MNALSVETTKNIGLKMSHSNGAASDPLDIFCNLSLAQKENICFNNDTEAIELDSGKRLYDDTIVKVYIDNDVLSLVKEIKSIGVDNIEFDRENQSIIIKDEDREIAIELDDNIWRKCENSDFELQHICIDREHNSVILGLEKPERDIDNERLIASDIRFDYDNGRIVDFDKMDIRDEPPPPRLFIKFEEREGASLEKEIEIDRDFWHELVSIYKEDAFAEAWNNNTIKYFTTHGMEHIEAVAKKAIQTSYQLGMGLDDDSLKEVLYASLAHDLGMKGMTEPRADLDKFCKENGLTEKQVDNNIQSYIDGQPEKLPTEYKAFINSNRESLKEMPLSCALYNVKNIQKAKKNITPVYEKKELEKVLADKGIKDNKELNGLLMEYLKSIKSKNDNDRIALESRIPDEYVRTIKEKSAEIERATHINYKLFLIKYNENIKPTIDKDSLDSFLTEKDMSRQELDDNIIRYINADGRERKILETSIPEEYVSIINANDELNNSSRYPTNESKLFAVEYTEADEDARVRKTHPFSSVAQILQIYEKKDNLLQDEKEREENKKLASHLILEAAFHSKSTSGIKDFNDMDSVFNCVKQIKMHILNCRDVVKQDNVMLKDNGLISRGRYRGFTEYEREIFKSIDDKFECIKDGDEDRYVIKDEYIDEMRNVIKVAALVTLGDAQSHTFGTGEDDISQRNQHLTPKLKEERYELPEIREHLRKQRYDALADASSKLQCYREISDGSEEFDLVDALDKIEVTLDEISEIEKTFLYLEIKDENLRFIDTDESPKGQSQANCCFGEANIQTSMFTSIYDTPVLNIDILDLDKPAVATVAAIKERIDECHRIPFYDSDGERKSIDININIPFKKTNNMPLDEKKIVTDFYTSYFEVLNKYYTLKGNLDEWPYLEDEKTRNHYMFTYLDDSIHAFVG